MIVCLGASALTSALRRRADVHIHRHTHDGVSHVHVHFHERGTEHTSGGATEQTAQAAPHSHKGARRPQESGRHTHAVSRLGFKPLLVGALHGLAGSAALTLLVLTRIESAALGLVYLAVFGVGSVFGMMLMSGLIGLPFAFGARRASRLAHGLQAFAGAASVAFGLWYAYEAGVANSFWGTFT
jgi:high-affinity nickel-transport protein